MFRKIMNIVIVTNTWRLNDHEREKETHFDEVDVLRFKKKNEQREDCVMPCTYGEGYT